MKKDELIEQLQNNGLPGDTEVMIQEIACENVRSLDSVSGAWYLDDGDEPFTLDLDEDLDDYEVDEDADPEKVIVLG